MPAKIACRWKVNDHDAQGPRKILNLINHWTTGSSRKGQGWPRWPPVSARG